MIKYRVRRGLFGKSVLQSIQGARTVWDDVPYDKAPRKLCSGDECDEVIKELEVEIAELTVKVESK